MGNATYKALPQLADSHCDHCDHCDEYRGRISKGRHAFSTAVLSYLVPAILIASFTLNGVLTYRQYFKPWSIAIPSKHSGLYRNVSTKGWVGGDYASLNRTLQDAAWNTDSLQSWHGLVALDDDYATAQGLSETSRWPWDPRKGTYMLAASHNMHCLDMLRTYANEIQDGVPQDKQQSDYPHFMHCLNWLRATVMCDADDTPLELSFEPDESGNIQGGLGWSTVRKCRDWGALVKWADSRSACYNPEARGGPDEYKNCPGGAEPWLRPQTHN